MSESTWPRVQKSGRLIATLPSGYAGAVNGGSLSGRRRDVYLVTRRELTRRSSLFCRERLRQQLSASGIELGFDYTGALHLNEACSDVGHRRGDFSVAENLCRRNLSLPMYPRLTDERIEHVASVLME